MSNKKILKRIMICIIIVISTLILCIIGLLIKQSRMDKKINNDFSNIYSNEKYKKVVAVYGIETIKQEVSCGYACIEMLSNWLGKDITEQILLEENNGKISTAMGNGFFKEMNKQFPEYETERYINLTNTELIGKIYDSLENGMPVPIEFAAIYQESDTQVWTLHFALVTALDIPNDSITVSNPYGYEETYTIKEFLNSTRYDSYENMEFYFKLGFLSRIFNKNTIYIIK
ncbi:hypothetical protein [Tissierella sp.]|uniref:hypothetical protein n=1 Tax=Tissierella sp. TaxID=41274 RepID=UPI002861BDA2|nr:hypothetical protein [Tissierella sp.]MDR7857849.1 hypothetical protein [Tissierella sp.]